MTIEQRIRKARPKLSTVAPLTNAIILSFITGNVIIAYGLWRTVVQQGHEVVIVNGIFSFQVYAVLFLILAIIMFWAWAINSWVGLKRSLLAGVALKSLWTVALVFTLKNGGSFAVFGAWIMLLAIQIATYVYFVTPPEENYG